MMELPITEPPMTFFFGAPSIAGALPRTEVMADGSSGFEAEALSATFSSKPNEDIGSEIPAASSAGAGVDPKSSNPFVAGSVASVDKVTPKSSSPFEAD